MGRCTRIAGADRERSSSVAIAGERVGKGEGLSCSIVVEWRGVVWLGRVFRVLSSMGVIEWPGVM